MEAVFKQSFVDSFSKDMFSHASLPFSSSFSALAENMGCFSSRQERKSANYIVDFCEMTNQTKVVEIRIIWLSYFIYPLSVTSFLVFFFLFFANDNNYPQA